MTEVFQSKAKEKRFKKEQRLGHRSEYRKPLGKGLRLTPMNVRKAKRSK